MFYFETQKTMVFISVLFCSRKQNMCEHCIILRSSIWCIFFICSMHIFLFFLCGWRFLILSRSNGKCRFRKASTIVHYSVFITHITKTHWNQNWADFAKGTMSPISKLFVFMLALFVHWQAQLWRCPESFKMQKASWNRRKGTFEGTY